MWKRFIDFELEIPASRVFLGADAKLLGTSTKIPLSICLNPILYGLLEIR